MDFYRVSEEVGAREPARVEVNFVSFIGIPVSYRRASRLAPRLILRPRNKNIEIPLGPFYSFFFFPP